MGGSGRRTAKGRAAVQDRIVLGGREIRYEIVWSNRTTAEIQLEPDLLRVRCPMSATRGRIRGILARHGDDILRRLGGIEAERRRRRARPRESFLYRGRRCQIVATEGKQSFGLKNGKFVVSTTVDGRVHERIDAAYREWIMGRALSYLPKRARLLGDRHGIWPSRITVRQQATRWGSATSKGTLSLNSMLMILPVRLSDYAILHELCHTIYPNHSGEFWALLESVYPNVKRAKEDLKKYADEV